MKKNILWVVMALIAVTVCATACSKKEPLQYQDGQVMMISPMGLTLSKDDPATGNMNLFVFRMNSKVKYEGVKDMKHIAQDQQVVVGFTAKDGVKTAKTIRVA